MRHSFRDAVAIRRCPSYRYSQRRRDLRVAEDMRGALNISHEGREGSESVTEYTKHPLHHLQLIHTHISITHEATNPIEAVSTMP